MIEFWQTGRQSGGQRRPRRRLLELIDLGIERFIVVGPGIRPEAAATGRTSFAGEVIPAVRPALAGRGQSKLRDF
jgi:hypothetical protein